MIYVHQKKKKQSRHHGEGEY